MRPSLTSIWAGDGMLAVHDLHAGYGHGSILNGINLVVPDGEIVGIVGRNGMGKSTLLRALIGLVRTPRGSIHFGGTDVSRFPAHARCRLGMGYVPESSRVFPRLSVRENLEVAAFATRQRRGRIEELLRAFPLLNEKTSEIASTLSGGQQKLLAIARALATDPRLLMLDEPSQGLQPSLAEEVLECVCTVNRRHGVSVLLVEQNLEFAAAAANRFYVLDRGEISAEMPSRELLGNKRLQYELLGI